MVKVLTFLHKELKIFYVVAELGGYLGMILGVSLLHLESLFKSFMISKVDRAEIDVYHDM